MDTRRRLLIVLVLVLFTMLPMFLNPPAAAAEKTIRLSNGVFNIEQQAGTSHKASLDVSNPSKLNIDRVYVYTSNILSQPDGSLDFSLPLRTDVISVNERSKNPATWISINMPAETRLDGNMSFISLPAGDSIPLSFSVNVPEGTPPGDYSAAIFMAMGSGSSDITDNSAVTVISGRIGVRLNIRVLGTLTQKISLDFLNTNNILFSTNVSEPIQIKNEGNTNISLSGSLRTHGGFLNQSKETSDTSLPQQILPNSSIITTQTLNISPLYFGPYTLTYSIGYIDKTTKNTLYETVERSVFIFPWYFIVVLIVFILLIGLIWEYKKRKSLRKHQDIEQGVGVEKTQEKKRDSIGADVPHRKRKKNETKSEKT